MSSRVEIAQEETRRLRQLSRAVMDGQIEIDDYREIRAAAIEACRGDLPFEEAGIEMPPARESGRTFLWVVVVGVLLLAGSIGAYLFASGAVTLG